LFIKKAAWKVSNGKSATNGKRAPSPTEIGQKLRKNGVSPQFAGICGSFGEEDWDWDYPDRRKTGKEKTALLLYLFVFEYL
jgi:hypothetical protein